MIGAFGSFFETVLAEIFLIFFRTYHVLPTGGSTTCVDYHLKGVI